MTDDRSLERAARSWIEAGPTQAPDRAIEAALLRIESTSQERDLRVPWRSPRMTTPARVATAAVIGVLAVGAAIFVLRPAGSSVGGPGPTPVPTISPAATVSPTPTPTPTPTPSGPAAIYEGLLAAGTYMTTPFAQSGSDACGFPPQAGCIDSTDDDAIRITLTVPDGWSGSSDGVSATDPQPDVPGGATLLFVRGASLYEDPCRTADTTSNEPEIPVGPSVDDFSEALAAHPLLDVTTPTDVTLAGYSGKYLELQVPDDISMCGVYRPWEPWYFAQGPGERWHLWILDVDGVRVVVQSIDHEETTATRRAELQAIVDSIQIEP
jgi:hypothetical protein